MPELLQLLVLTHCAGTTCGAAGSSFKSKSTANQKGSTAHKRPDEHSLEDGDSVCALTPAAASSGTKRGIRRGGSIEKDLVDGSDTTLKENTTSPCNSSWPVVTPPGSKGGKQKIVSKSQDSQQHKNKAARREQQQRKMQMQVCVRVLSCDSGVNVAAM